MARQPLRPAAAKGDDGKSGNGAGGLFSDLGAAFTSGTQKLTAGLSGGTQKLKRGSDSGKGSALDNSTVFVAGATGRLGARIVRELLSQGFKVRAGVRNMEKADVSPV